MVSVSSDIIATTQPQGQRSRPGQQPAQDAFAALVDDNSDATPNQNGNGTSVSDADRTSRPASDHGSVRPADVAARPAGGPRNAQRDPAAATEISSPGAQIAPTGFDKAAVSALPVAGEPIETGFEATTSGLQTDEGFAIGLVVVAETANVLATATVTPAVVAVVIPATITVTDTSTPSSGDVAITATGVAATAATGAPVTSDASLSLATAGTDTGEPAALATSNIVSPPASADADIESKLPLQTAAAAVPLPAATDEAAATVDAAVLAASIAIAVAQPAKPTVGISGPQAAEPLAGGTGFFEGSAVLQPARVTAAPADRDLAPRAVPNEARKPDAATSDSTKPEALDPQVSNAATVASHEHRSLPTATARVQDATFDPSAQPLAPQPASPPVQHGAMPATTAATAQLSVTLATSVAIPFNGLAIDIAQRALGGSSRFDIRLDPAELGRIDVRLDVDRNGNVTSHLTVEKPATLDMLRRDAPQLQRALEDAGLKTADSGLQFSLRDQSSSNRDDNGNSGRHSHRLVINDDTVIPAETAGRSYSRLPGSGSGVDIKV